MPTLFDLYGIDLGQPDEPPPPPKSGLIRRAVGDTAVSAVKGAIGLPEAAVGLTDIVTGGRVGKALENEGGTVGFRPKQTREYLDTLYSPEQQEANRKVQEADGFFATAEAALRNPSTIAHAVVEAAPSMLGAAGAARGIMAAAPRVNPLIAVGAGEGVFSAGYTAEQIRQQTDDGLLTGEQSLIAGTSGALTGAIASVAGKIANKLGIGDVQQMLAGVQQAGPKAEKALTRALLEGFATEGVLQELPQSAQEQIAQNVALGKPWDEGVGNAAAMGTLAGGVMGVGGAAIGRLQRQPEPIDPLAEGNARADAAMERLATTNDVGQMIEAAREIATATPLSQGISPEQEARVMQAGEELAQADLTDIKNMGRLDRTRSPEPPAPSAPIIPASEEGPAPFLDRLLIATWALQDPAVRLRVQQAAGPQYLAQLDQYAEVANTPGFMDGIGDQVRDRHLELLERAVFPERFRKPAPQIQRAERRRSDPVPIEPFRAEPVTDPVLDYVDAKRAENTMAARAFVKEFEAGRITRRDVVRVMQDRNADPLGSNPDPLASIQPATPAPNLIQQRLEAAARAGQAQPTGIQIEPSRARPKGQSDERNPERAVPGEGRPVDTGNQPGTSGVVSGELQQPGAPGTTGEAVPSAVPGVDAERAGRGLGDDALSDLAPETFAGSIKAEIERRQRQMEARGRRKSRPPPPAQQPDEPENPYRIMRDSQGGYVLENDDYTIGGSGDGSPRRFKSEAEASSWASRNGFEIAGSNSLSSAQAQAGTPAEGAGDSRPTPAPQLPKAKRGERFDSAEFADALSRVTLPNGMRFDAARDSGGGFTGRVRIMGGNGQAGHIDFNYNHVSGEVLINKSELAEALRGKGVGKAAYIALNNALVESGLPPLASDPNNLSQSAVHLWKSLVRDGLAVERSDGRIGYSFVDAAQGTGDSRPTPGQAQQGERTYDQLVDEELAQTRQRYTEAGKEIGLTFEQFMQDVEDGRRSGHSVKEAREQLPAMRADLEAVKAGRKSPRSVVGVGGTKAQAVKWTEGQIKRLEDRIATGGQSEPTNRSNYNRTLRDILDGKDQQAKKPAEQAAPAAQAPAKKLPFVNKEDGARLFGKDKKATQPLDTAANEAATSPQNDLPEPTEAQKEAGNYRVGRIKVAGLDISVENPAGSERSGIDPDGKKWRNTLAHHYGYLRNTSGADGDHVDVFVNPGTPEDYDGQVFVVDQADTKTGRFDEHKVMMGFPSAKAAQEAYQANYAKDWTGLRAVQPMTMEQFKAWVSDPANTKKPAAKGVKPGKGEKVERPDELVELRKRESALKSLRECLG